VSGNRRRGGGRAKGQAKSQNQGRAPAKNRRRRGRAKKAPDGVEFWGDVQQLPPPEQRIRITDDPSAVVRSLGPPPLAGQARVAEHYFEAVYDRAVNLATALAAAGDLIELEDLDDT
jgi:hypothetical protein